MQTDQDPGQEEHKTWHEFANSLLAVGSNLFGSAEISLSEKGASDVKAQALTLLCRTLSHLQAVVLLTRERFVVEARTITRCCFENLFYVVALREHGDAFVKEMGLHEVNHRRARAEFLLECQNRLTNTEWADDLRRMLKELKKKFTKSTSSLNPKELAGRGPLKDAYLFYAQLSADSAHPGPSSLSRYFCRIEHNGGTAHGIDLAPPATSKELGDTLNLACHATLGVIVGVNEILGGTAANSEIVRITEEYRKLNRFDQNHGH